MKEIISKLLGISLKSYYNWQHERLIIPFLNQYFTEEELLEYINNGSIKKLELIKHLSYDDLNEKLSSQNNSIYNLTDEYIVTNLKIKIFENLKDDFQIELLKSIKWFALRPNMEINKNEAKLWMLDQLEDKNSLLRTSKNSTTYNKNIDKLSSLYWFIRMYITNYEAYCILYSESFFEDLLNYDDNLKGLKQFSEINDSHHNPKFKDSPN